MTMVLSMERWLGKVAVITGASSGIGAAIAEKLVEDGLKERMVLSMDRWVGKVAVVTDTTACIGVAIAEGLVEQGLKVVALATSKERMDDLANKLSRETGKLYSILTDITKEQEVLDAFKWIKENAGPVHILVNSANVYNLGRFIESETEAWEQVLDVNVLGLCIVTREAIRDMKANNVDGHIIHINSTLAHQIPNFPILNLYPASTFAVRALAETLRLELNAKRSKIKITNLSLGAAQAKMTKQSIPKIMLEEVERMIRKKRMLETEDPDPEGSLDNIQAETTDPPEFEVILEEVERMMREKRILETKDPEGSLDSVQAERTEPPGSEINLEEVERMTREKRMLETEDPDPEGSLDNVQAETTDPPESEVILEEVERMMREKRMLETENSEGSLDTIQAETTEPPISEIILEEMERMAREKQTLDMEDVVDGVVYVLSTPPHVQIQELIIRPVIEPQQQ